MQAIALAASVAFSPSRISSARLRTSAPSCSAADDRTTLGTLDIPALGVGMLNFPLNVESDETTAAAISALSQAGCNFIDTAEAYPPFKWGCSERLTADCAARCDTPPVVATKFAAVPWRQDAASVVKAARASAERLGVETIPLYQIHFPHLQLLGEKQDAAFWDGLAEVYHSGLAANVGVSNYGVEMVTAAHAALAARGVPLASNQIQYSLLFRRTSQPVVDVCKELDVKVLSYFPLANGLLAGKYSAESLPSGPKRLTMAKYVTGGVEDRGIKYPEGGCEPLLQTIREIAAVRGKTVAQVSLNWIVCQGVVPIPGARSSQQAIDNLGALGWRLSDEEVQRLNAVADSLGFEFSNGGFVLK